MHTFRGTHHDGTPYHSYHTRLYQKYPRYHVRKYTEIKGVPLRLLTAGYSVFFLEEKQTGHSLEGMQGYIVPVYRFVF